MSEPVIKVALIGYGLAGSVFHAPLISSVSGLRLDAIVTTNAERAEHARSLYPHVQIVPSVEEIWSNAEKYNLVVVASPNKVHEEQARAALNHGLAVVVDKPMAPSAEACKSLIELSRKQGKLLSVFQNRRWDNDFLTLRSLLDQGTLGKIVRFESRYERFRAQPKPGGWREKVSHAEGGGLLYDLGSHLIDQACFLFGEPQRIYAELGRKRVAAEADDDVFVALQFPGDINAHMWMSLVARIPGPRLRVLGLGGAYEKYGMDPQENMLRDGMTPKSQGWAIEPENCWGSLVTADGAIARVRTQPGCYESYYAKIYQALIGKGEVPVKPEDAYRTTRIIEAAIEGCSENRSAARRPLFHLESISVTMPDFTVLFAVCAIVAGAIASVAGFGIGSILTPILSLSIGTKLAVSAVCIPHLAATSWRCWALRQHIDKKVLFNFGITSAIGGFCGALLHAEAQSYILTMVFGALLVIVSLLSLTGLDAKLRFGRKRSGIAGGISGLLGGMVGNQGGIRSAAMLTFDLSKESFVGTATAIGVIVDLARLPVYIASEANELLALWPCIAIGTAGTLIGTFLGTRLLHHIPQKTFKKIVATIILILGFTVLLRGTA